MHDINDENALTDSRSRRGISRTWEGRLGRRRFRVQWDREQDAARVRFQAPFTVDDDPDGLGVPFTPDLGLVWERGRPAHVFGRYAERLNKAQQEATERLNKAQQEAPATLEKIVGELENQLATLRENLKRRAETQALQKPSSTRRPSAQRVPIEYDKATDPLDEDLVEGLDEEAITGEGVGSERNARRRAILEAYRAGAISLEEAELQLSALE